MVKEWIQTSHGGLPDMRYELESVVGSGDEAVCRVRLTGTHRLNASGQVIEHWGIMQEGALMAQLGVTQQSIDLTTPATAVTT